MSLFFLKVLDFGLVGMCSSYSFIVFVLSVNELNAFDVENTEVGTILHYSTLIEGLKILIGVL